MNLLRNYFLLFLSAISLNAAYFDPHNHINGIIKATDYGNLEKVISGEEMSIEELSRLWDALSAFYSNAFVNNQRHSRGTVNALVCNEPKDFMNSPDRENYRQVLVRNIERILSATPHTGFDSAYAQRAYIENNYIFRNLSTQKLIKAQQDLRRAVLYRLALDNIAFVEMSNNFIGGDPSGRRLQIMLNFEKMIQDLLSPTTSAENMPLKELLQAQNLPIPKIRWLLMAHTTELARYGTTAILNYSKGECDASPLPSSLKSSPFKDFFKILSERDIVAGVGVAGPENTCFTNEGAANFKEFITVAYTAAKARRQTTPKASKLLIHIHAGEGAPLLEEQAFRDKESACASFATLPKVKKRDTKAVHALESSINIGVVTKLIADMKQQLPDIDNFLVFRIGHATHVTKAQAKEIKDLGIEVDVNLSSNIATGAWSIPEEILSSLSAPLPTRMLEHLLTKANLSPVAIFKDHGLKWLLYYGVVTILGTDGAGVEHSDLKRDYDSAQKLIHYWNQTDKDFENAGISIDNLIKNQNIHMENMGYDERL